MDPILYIRSRELHRIPCSMTRCRNVSEPRNSSSWQLFADASSTSSLSAPRAEYVSPESTSHHNSLSMSNTRQCRHVECASSAFQPPRSRIMRITAECLETESNGDNLQVRGLQLHVPWPGLLRQVGDGRRTETEDIRTSMPINASIARTLSHALKEFRLSRTPARC